MKIPSILVLLPLLTLASVPMTASGQSGPAAAAAPADSGDQIEVGEVKFTGVRAPSGDTWLEALVEVAVRPGGKSAAGDFIDNVRVTLNLGIEIGDAASKKFHYYRASAEAVSLEGGKAAFRFYLPPEIVKRDRLTAGDTGKHFVVECEIAGRQLPPLRGGASAKASSEAGRRSLLSQVTAEGARNEGVLVPQHLSPFASDSQRRGPSIVRREATR